MTQREGSMTARKVQARDGNEDTSPSAEVEYDFGDNLGEAVELFGEDVVFSRFVAASVVDLQALIRRHLGGEKPKTQDEISKLVAEWKPGVSSRKRRSNKEKAEELIAGMSEQEKAQLLEQLMAAA